MGNFIRHTNRDCPRCAGARNDCRSSWDGGLVFCRDDGYHTGWVSRGTAKIGFPIWARQEDADAFSQQSREEILARKAASDLKKKQELAKHASISMSEVDRNRNYLKIISQLKLSGNHQSKLIDRGLTSEQIKAHGYVTVFGSDSVSVDKGTPGVNAYGTKLDCATGILIPIYGCNNNVLGAQVRLFDSEVKYKWASNTTRPSALPNGELPLAVFNRHKYINDGIICLVEGTGFKPHIASIRLNRYMIGAAGANWVNGSEQLKAAVEGSQAKTVHILPDGGMLKNKPIMDQYRKVAQLLERWDISVLFGWWGQIEKSEGDIDEISQEKIHSIEYITPADFFAKSSVVDWLEVEKPIDRLKPLKTLPFHNSRSVKYTPGLDIPKNHRLVFEADQRTDVILDAYSQGHKSLVESSFMGSGKSHCVPKLDVDMFDGANKIFYLSPTYKNPSIRDITYSHTMLPPRHNGLVHDDGNWVKGTPDDDETPRLESNCHLTNQFTNAFNHGVGSSDAKDLICSGCKFQFECKNSEGDGYGYKYQRKTALATSHIRADINGLAPIEDYDYSKSVLILEESGLLELTKKLVLHNDKLFSGAFLLNDNPSNDDFGNRELNTFLRSLDDELNKAVNEYGEIVDLDSLVIPGNINEVLAYIAFLHDSQIEAGRINSNISDLLFIEKLLKILTKSEQGTIIRHRNKLEIEFLNQHHVDIIRNAKFVVCLDATPDWLTLNFLFQTDILEIREEMLPLKNLTINEINIAGMKHKRNLTSNTHLLTSRVESIKQTLTLLHPGLAVLGFKGNNDVYYWFNHNRGSNAFSGVDSKLSIGQPRINLTAAKATYQTIHGNTEGFEDWYEIKTYCEIVQDCGRQRAQNYPDRQFNLYVLTEGSNLDAIAHLYGCGYNHTNGLEWHPQAASKSQLTKLKILAAIQELITEGKSVTQKAISNLSGVAQSKVSEYGYSEIIRNCFRELKEAKTDIPIQPNEIPLVAMLSGDVLLSLYSVVRYQSWIGTLKPIASVYSEWLVGSDRDTNVSVTKLSVYFDKNVKSHSELHAKFTRQLERVLESPCPWLVEDYFTGLHYHYGLNTDDQFYRANLLDSIKAFPKYVQQYDDGLRKVQEFIHYEIAFLESTNTVVTNSNSDDDISNQLKEQCVIIEELEATSKPVLETAKDIIQEEQANEPQKQHSPMPTDAVCSTTQHLPNDNEGSEYKSPQPVTEKQTRSFVQELLGTDDHTTDVFMWWWRLNSKDFASLESIQERNTPYQIKQYIHLFNGRVTEIAANYASEVLGVK